MSERLKKMSACYFALINRPINMDSLDSRILFQKAIYFMEEAGIKLSYNFSWYIRGPYSPVLASDGFESSAIDVKEINADILSNEDKNIISTILSEFSEIKDLNYAELYASIIYFMKLGRNDECLVKTIRDYKPWYSEEEIRKAISKIKNSSVFKGRI